MPRLFGGATALSWCFLQGSIGILPGTGGVLRVRSLTEFPQEQVRDDFTISKVLNWNDWSASNFPKILCKPLQQHILKQICHVKKNFQTHWRIYSKFLFLQADLHGPTLVVMQSPSEAALHTFISKGQMAGSEPTAWLASLAERESQGVRPVVI